MINVFRPIMSSCSSDFEDANIGKETANLCEIAVNQHVIKGNLEEEYCRIITKDDGLRLEYRPVKIQDEDLCQLALEGSKELEDFCLPLLFED